MNRLFKIFKFSYSIIYKLIPSTKKKYIIKPYSQKGIKWLYYRNQIDGVYIQHAENGGEFCIPKTKYKADGYAKVTNTIYEFNGCIFHGCKKCYDPKFVNHLNGKTMKELYDKTIKKEREIKKLGYNLITIWEHEWDYLCKNGKDKVGWTSYFGGLVYGFVRRFI